MRKIEFLLLFVLLASALLPQAAPAAALSERSAVRPGLWWDPARNGSGFEFFRAGDELAVVWYTYRNDSMPVWYSAHGRFDANGEWNAPLFKQRWSNGARGTPREVGQLRLTRVHHEQIELAWELDGQQGTQSLVPFPLAGIYPEVDHSGAWYDPQREGFGLSLTEQDEQIAAGLYFYDAAGEPTWRAGTNGGAGNLIALKGSLGACPGCSQRLPQPLDESDLQLEFVGETALRARYSVSNVSPSSVAWNLDGNMQQLSTPASVRPADRQIAHFDDDASLRAYLDEGLLRLPSYGYSGIDFSPAPPTASFSPTNLQESAVDEADRLKTDGRLLYAIAKDEFENDRAAIRVAEVTGDGTGLLVRNELALPAPLESIGYSGLYLDQEYLVALQGSTPYSSELSPLWIAPIPWTNGETRVTLFRRASDGSISQSWTAEFDSHLVTSRRIGSKLYLVLRKTSQVDGIEFDNGSNPDVAARNQALLDAVPLEQLLPRIRRGDEQTWSALLTPQQVYLPVVGAQESLPGFLSVVAIDLNAPDQFKAISVVGPAGHVYVSPQHLYLATQRSALQYDAELGFHPSGFQVTDIHQIALGDDGPELKASGAIEGYLDRDPDRAVFRFSEHEGRLRVVSVGGPWGVFGPNRVTLLEPSTRTAGLLRTVSFLPNRARPAPIGKPDEQLYGTRFVGDRLYAVTFLKIDPLYVIDLSDANDPKIAGEVELPGFSDYLHPIGDSMLFGIGHDARSAQGWGDSRFAWFQGLQFSLFDVADPARPRVMQQQVLGKRGTGSAVLSSHHALSVLPVAGGTSFTLPVRVHESNGTEPVPTPDNFTFPWSWSGLQKISVIGTSAADARFEIGPSFATHRRASQMNHSPDDAIRGARSVQFANGTVYVEAGRFWLARNAGEVMEGPR